VRFLFFFGFAVALSSGTGEDLAFAEFFRGFVRLGVAVGVGVLFFL
jgi:hypothetical protein